MTAVLEVEDLRISIPTSAGPLTPVDGLSFSVEPGRTLAIVGESGSGKSLACRSLLGLLPTRDSVATGSIRIGGAELSSMSPAELRAVRGSQISMVFQDPTASLNPVMSVGDQIVEAIRLHRPMSARRARAEAIDALELVGIPEPAKRFRSYPHEFSGGMRQRVVIAMAIVNRPSVIVADEPTASLDVVTQAQILDLFRTLQRESGCALVIVTHDFGVVGELADDVMVLYAGQTMERGPIEQIIREPRHPYTWGLLRSLPSLAGPRVNRQLQGIPGSLPSLGDPAPGCRFAPRCGFASDACREGRHAVDGDTAPADGCVLPLDVKQAHGRELGLRILEAEAR